MVAEHAGAHAKPRGPNDRFTVVVDRDGDGVLFDGSLVERVFLGIRVQAVPSGAAIEEPDHLEMADEVGFDGPGNKRAGHRQAQLGVDEGHVGAIARICGEAAEGGDPGLVGVIDGGIDGGASVLGQGQSIVHPAEQVQQSVGSDGDVGGRADRENEIAIDGEIIPVIESDRAEGLRLLRGVDVQLCPNLRTSPLPNVQGPFPCGVEDITEFEAGGVVEGGWLSEVERVRGQKRIPVEAIDGIQPEAAHLIKGVAPFVTKGVDVRFDEALAVRRELLLALPLQGDAAINPAAEVGISDGVSAVAEVSCQTKARHKPPILKQSACTDFCKGATSGLHGGDPGEDLEERPAEGVDEL